MEKFKEEISSFLEKFENAIEGPFILGKDLSLVDLLVYPWFERWVVIEHYLKVPIDEKYMKIKNWL